MADKTQAITCSDATKLGGKLLLATPNLADANFAQSVIYLYHHGADGALGFVLNRPAAMKFRDLVRHSFDTKAVDVCIPIVQGGPIDTKRGFVLHTNDFRCRGTQCEKAQEFALTTSTDILVALAQATGPRKALIALGYAGWGAGQLETELQQDSWLIAPSNEELIFDGSLGTLYATVLDQLGITAASYSANIGQA